MHLDPFMVGSTSVLVDLLISYRIRCSVKMPEPLLRIELEETNCWMFDWANSELIAIGTTNGTLYMHKESTN